MYKKLLDAFFTLFTAGEFAVLGFLLTRGDYKFAVVGGLIGLVYWMIYIKQTQIEHQIFELKQLIEKMK